jgi:4-diphosphocytidyl-2-C-methyl-D-erythritol kinase
LTSPDGSPILGEFQAVAWSINHRPLSEVPLQNEFEPVVFAQHPELSVLLRKLKRSGASVARMTGSGSSLFGVFPGAAEVRGAADKLPGSMPARFLTRAAYAKRWRQALGEAAPSSTLF